MVTWIENPFWAIKTWLRLYNTFKGYGMLNCFGYDRSLYFMYTYN